MEITFDPRKSERNARERGLPFERAHDFEFETAIAEPTLRNRELRVVAFGYLEDRLHVLCFKDVEGGIRVISLRKANKREAIRHGFALRR